MSDSANAPIRRVADVADTVHIRLFTVDWATIGARGWIARNIQSPYWRFYQNNDDGAYLDLPSGERFPFLANTGYFIPAGVAFSGGNEVPFRHFFIHFDVVGLSRLTMKSLFAVPVALPPDISFSDAVREFARSLTDFPVLDLAGQCRAKALIYEGISRCFEALSPVARAKLERDNAERAAIAPALLHIDAFLQQSLSVPDLAALCFLSPDHFARRFKQGTGQTPNAYVREQRVTKAAQALLFTDKSLDQIALQCGFGNRHYLTRVFTRLMGIAPAAYRRHEPIS